MRKLLFLGAMLVTAEARSADRGPYFGAAGAAFIGGGLEGLDIPALGLELTTGYRISRLFSVEAFFDARYQTDRFLEPEEGAMCTGETTDQWHWETFGARLWVHAKDSPHVAVSVALPWLAGGVAYDHERPVFVPAPTDMCARFLVPRDHSGPMIVFGLIAVAVELKLDARFAFRLTTGAEIDLAQDAGIGVLALTAAFGPVVHF